MIKDLKVKWCLECDKFYERKTCPHDDSEIIDLTQNEVVAKIMNLLKAIQIEVSRIDS
jgi:hypothetical protein